MTPHRICRICRRDSTEVKFGMRNGDGIYGQPKYYRHTCNPCMAERKRRSPTYQALRRQPMEARP